MNRELSAQQNVNIPKSPEETMMAELEVFIDENNATSQQVEQAYTTVLLLEPIEDIQDESVRQIAIRMNEMVKNQFPLDHLANLAFAEKKYCAFIDELNIYPREREILKSIVEKKRAGEISMYLTGHEPKYFKTKEYIHSRKLLVQELTRKIESAIKSAKGKKVEFMFVED